MLFKIPGGFTLLLLTSLVENGYSQSAGQGTYTPNINVACPTNLTRRTNTQFTLDPNETEYIVARRALLPAAWTQWVGNGSRIGYTSEELGLSNAGSVPVIGLASSGGGFRSALYSAGALTALDIRNSTAQELGTGGLLQVASYYTGLSGGSWMMGSLAINDFPTSRDVILGNGNLTGWLLSLDLLLPDELRATDFYAEIVAQIIDKAHESFSTGLTDIWARALSYHLFPGTTLSNFFSSSSHGAGVLYSSIQSTSSFLSHTIPYPIAIINTRPPGFVNLPPGTNLPLNATVYEATPFEFGSYDPDLEAFVNMKFLGTKLQGLQPASQTSCVTNFDQAGFIVGSSSSLFFKLLYDDRKKLAGFDAGPAQFLLNALEALLKDVSTDAEDVGVVPNPFRGLNPDRYEDSNSDNLDLIDGGSNLETLPLRPLLIKPRGVEVLVALDGVSDDDNDFPSLTSLIQTQQHQSVVSTIAQSLPPVPTSEVDAIRDNLNKRPVFFGCNPSNVQSPEWPLLVYIPNAPPSNGDSPVTNTDTFKLSYTDKHTGLFLEQAFGTATSGFVPGQLGPDPEWPTCLQCATVDRQRYKGAGGVIARSTQCQACFTRYCYDPSNPPSADQLATPGRKVTFVDPDPQQSFLQKNKKLIIILASVLGGIALIAIVFGVVYCYKRHLKRKLMSNASPGRGGYVPVDS